MSDGRLWTFANFKIRDILDVDLVSTTYRATTVDGDESRRLRVFTGDVADDQLAQVQTAVVAEALQARRVRHPHILAIHDADRQGDRAYIVSDDIHGAVLRDFIAHHHPFKTSTVLAMAWQLAEALDAVHAGGIVHGSINPHTIWVADSPGRDVPMIYLTGFGAARALARHLTSQNGAPTSDDLLYVEPDQVRDGRASPEADRYALACAVYHLMTGTPPFRRGTVNAQLGAHRFAMAEPPSSVRDDLPPALDSVFARALAKVTSDRYPSASALMIAVERGLRGQEETRTPDTGRGDEVLRTTAADRTVFGATAMDPTLSQGRRLPATRWERSDEWVERGETAKPTASGAASATVTPAADAADAAVPAVPTTGGGADAADHAPDDGDRPAGEDAPVAAVADDAADTAARPETDAGEGPPAEHPAPEGPPAEHPAPEVTGTGVQSGTATDDGPRAPSDGAPAASDGAHPALDGPHAAGNGDTTSTESAGPLEHRRTAGLEARRAAGPLRGDAGPSIAFPPRAPADVAEPSSRWRSVRAVVGTRPGVLAVVAGVLVVVVAGAAALVTLGGGRGDARPPEAAAADRGRRAQPETVRPLWTTAVGERPVRSIAVTEDAVLIDADTTIGALDPASGTPLWTKRAPARVTDVAVLHGVIAVSTADGINAYDVDSGRSRWRLADAAAVVAGDEAFYVAARDDTGIVLSAIDPRDGVVEPLTTIADGATPAGRQGRLALAFAGTSKKTGPTLYVLTRATLYAFDPEAGFVRWRAPVRDEGHRETPRLRARPWVHSLGVAAGAAFVVDREGMVCRHAAASGEQVWTTCAQFPPEGPPRGSRDAKSPSDLDAAPTLLAGGGRVVVASGDAIATYDFTTGSSLWSHVLADGAQSAVAGEAGLVYVALGEDVVTALDQASGRERWRAPDVDGVTALAADDDGVFAGLADGSVVRLVQRTVG